MCSKHFAALCLPFALLALLAVSCSKTTEAVTRPEQEKMFRELFGFAPPTSITEIKYTDTYNRQAMNGGWGRWMRFTYDEEVFSKILKAEGCKQRDEGQALSLESPAAPEWVPKVDQRQVTIYLRSDKDTKEVEGFSFEEYLWRDTNSNFVYFHKRYWD